MQPRLSGRMPLSATDKYCIAIDLGTTTIAAALVDGAAGRIVASGGGLNPQRQYGLDVISRLAYACQAPENLHQLQNLVNNELARITTDLLLQAGVVAETIGMVAIAGNPTMSHLLLGLPVDTLAHPPYRPIITTAHRLMTGDLGWHLNLPLYVFPSPGGFVGGDTVAFLYGLSLEELLMPRKAGAGTPLGPSGSEPALFLDLGTNGEIALLSGGRLYATSAAAGPAFEGGNLSCGMAALPGAIDTVVVEDGRLVLHALADRPPQGLCGSGVLDTISLLLREGVLEPTGGLLDPAQIASPLGERIREINGERHFVIYRDAAKLISLSQADIRQVQLAKGAVRAGMEVLFARAAIDRAAVAAVVITGSFGVSLSLESLKSIGILTESMVKKSQFVRQGALTGVVRKLTAQGGIDAAEGLAAALRIVPLSGTPLFERYFMQYLDF